MKSTDKNRDDTQAPDEETAAVVPIEPVPPPATPAATTGPTTPSIPTLQPADADLGEPGNNEEERLDEALQESMTTSDPVSIKIA